MGGCSLFSFSLVHYRMSRIRAFYKSNGFRSQLISLENGSTIHCWVQTEEREKEDSKRRRSWRRGAQAHQSRPHRASSRERLKSRQDGRRRGLWRGGSSQARPRKPLHLRPALVFLHGFGGDGTTAWQHQIATFCKDYRVFVPDLLFFGKSSTRNEQRTEVFQADCVANMLMKLNVQGAHVVGTSYGGFVAFWIAYKYPQLCWKVVLSSTGICMNLRTNDDMLRQCNLKSIDEILLPTTVDGLQLTFSLVYARPPVLPDCIVQQILDIFYKMEDRRQRLELLHAVVIGSERCPPLPVLTQEVLIIWGREDHLFKLPLANKLREHLGWKNTQVIVIEGAGHLPQIEKSKEYNAVISNFLDDSESSQSRSR